MSYENKFKVLIVDDEKEYQEVFKMILDDSGYYTKAADSGEDALKKLQEENFDVVLTDLIMDGMSGMELLDRIKKEYPDIEVILITGYGSIENAVSAMKKGAFSYFIKSHNPEALLIEIEKLRKLHQLETDNKILRDQQGRNNYLLKTNNKKFKYILNLVEKAAASSASILITGESGVGKEVMARYIHSISSRSGGHFIAVNCQALSENLLESELFGHEKGSFTGALDKRIGRFEEASGGTLFLDEIGEIPVSTQVKLLRAIETKSIERIGRNKPISIDIRIISATNRDIENAIAEGSFRKDLFYRINTIMIDIPPLRERKEDLPMLIDFFLEKSKVEQKKRIDKIEDGVMDFLLTYDYPGNIRELKNIIERLVVLSQDGFISVGDLPKYKKSPSIETCSNDEIVPLRNYRKGIEAEYIGMVIEKCNGNLSEAARCLNITRRQLFNKVVEYNLKYK